jgi:hypothetical protein
VAETHSKLKVRSVIQRVVMCAISGTQQWLCCCAVHALYMCCVDKLAAEAHSRGVRPCYSAVSRNVCRQYAVADRH